MNITTTLRIAVLVAIVGGVSLPAGAAFVAIDDFESYTVGTAISGQGNWTASDSASGVAADPEDAANNALAVSYNYKFARNNLSATIADGTTGTFFYQFRLSGTTLSLGHGLSDQATPGIGSNTAYEVRMISGNSGSTKYDDAGTSVDFNPALTLSTDTWYSLWLVADNSADTTRIYIEGGSFATQTELVGPDALNFKYGTTGPLVTFLIVANSSNGSSKTYFDNLYIDTTGANTSNPLIPEPASMAMLAVGGLMMLRRRR